MNEYELSTKGLQTLRNIAHELNIPGARNNRKYTTKNKDELIQQILKFQRLKSQIPQHEEHIIPTVLRSDSESASESSESSEGFEIRTDDDIFKSSNMDILYIGLGVVGIIILSMRAFSDYQHYQHLSKNK